MALLNDFAKSDPCLEQKVYPVASAGFPSEESSESSTLAE